MALNIKTVLQAQWAEFVIAQLAGFPAAHLIAELFDPLVNQLAVNGIVFVHETSLSKNQLAADKDKHGGQDAAQNVLRNLGRNLSAEPDAGQ